MRKRHFALGLVLLLVVAAVYVAYVQWLGFPDGALTELEHAERILFRVAAPPASALALASFVLGSWRPCKPGSFDRLAVATAILVTVAVAFEIGFRRVLDHGGGG